MFDIGFSELMLIAVVALVVIGPERLPSVARTVGSMLGRAQRYFNSVKAEVNRELQLEELKRIQQETYDRVMAMEVEVHGGLAKVESVVHETAASVTDAVKAVETDTAAVAVVAPALAPEPLLEPAQSVAEADLVEATPADLGQADLFASSEENLTRLASQQATAH